MPQKHAEPSHTTTANDPTTALSVSVFVKCRVCKVCYASCHRFCKLLKSKVECQCLSRACQGTLSNPVNRCLTCRNSTGLFMRQHMMNFTKFTNLDKMIDSHLMSTHLEETLLSPETKHHHLISHSGRSTTGETTLKSQYLTSCKQYTAAVSTHKTVPRQALQRRAVMHQTGKCILIAGQ